MFYEALKPPLIETSGGYLKTPPGIRKNPYIYLVFRRDPAEKRFKTPFFILFA